MSTDRPTGAARGRASDSTDAAPAGDPLRWRVGLIGYGEVGRIVAEDLRAKGVTVAAFDRGLDETSTRTLPSSQQMRAHAAAHGVALASDHAALAALSDLVICAVTADQTVAAATACAPGLRARVWYVDFNSASPGAKRTAADRIEAAGARYVEGAVMTSVPPHRIRVPLLLGGPHAAAFAPLLNSLGFAAKAGPAEPGIVSATKMCRSVMIKGLEAMVIESLTAARAWGVEEEVLASLTETFPGIDWERQASYFFERVILHGRRRAEEMRESANTVREAGLEPWSASGTADRQEWVADLAERGTFGEPRDAHADWRIQADRLLAASGRESVPGRPARIRGGRQ